MQKIDLTIHDEVHTFLNPKRPFAEEFKLSADVSILNAYVDIKYYPGQKGGLALGTPYLYFPADFYPYIFTLPIFFTDIYH